MTKDRLLEAARKSDCNRTRDTIVLGSLASRWVATQPERAAAIAELRAWYAEHGLRGAVLNVNRQIHVFWLSAIFGVDTIRGLGITVVRALLPLVKRDARTGHWEIRPGVTDQARQIVAQVADEHWLVDQVESAVLALFPTKSKKHAKPPRRLSRLQQQIRRLAPAELAELMAWLQSLPRAAAA